MKTNIRFILTIWPHLGLVLFYYLSSSCFLEVYPELKSCFLSFWKDTQFNPICLSEGTQVEYEERGCLASYRPIQPWGKWDCPYTKFPRKDTRKGCIVITTPANM